MPTFNWVISLYFKDSNIHFYIFLLFTDNELTDAKEKLSKADSSSSDSEDEAAPKRKKPVTIVDKPTEEVSFVRMN